MKIDKEWNVFIEKEKEPFRKWDNKLFEEKALKYLNDNDITTSYFWDQFAHRKAKHIRADWDYYYYYDKYYENNTVEIILTIYQRASTFIRTFERLSEHLNVPMELFNALKKYDYESINL